MLYAITADDTGEIIVWGGAPLRTAVDGETAHELPDAGVADQRVIDTERGCCTKVVDGRFVPMTDAERLPGWKQLRLQGVDARTDEILALGFGFEGARFSLSVRAQSRMEGVWQLKDAPEFTWPLQWSSIDDLYVANFDSAAEFELFFLTAVGTLRAVIQSAYPVRAAIVAASDRAALDAIEDDR
ncbi:MAG: hypothetical protein QGG14_00835 [Planctomycetota bacterium]|jgi:hypothetical protein|nr:hypothetical protein [Planctomycetota bacterium]